MSNEFTKIANTTIYQVGGVVRDRLLGIPIKDIDWVVVGATPQLMKKNGFQTVGKDFPVFLHPQTHEEYALARTERKTAAGYHGFEFDTDQAVTLEQDLARRDLTINAMAQAETGEIIDPFNGQLDLKNRKLRHVSNAFREDPVRLLRVARFASRYARLGFTVATETMQLMQQMVTSGEAEALVSERVFKEFSQALAEDSPQVFIQVLRECGALKVILPEIDILFGIPNPVHWHPEIDTGIHTLMVLEQCSLLSKDPMVRFAALCHDLGKGITPKALWPSHKAHEKAGVKIIKQLCQRLSMPKQWRELAELCSEFHLHTHKLAEMKATTIVKALERMDAFRRPERFEQYLLVCEADFKGRTGYEKKDYPQKVYFRKLMQAATSIDTASIVKNCDNPQNIQQNIHVARANAVKQVHSKKL